MCILPLPFADSSNVFRAVLGPEREIRSMKGSELDDCGRARGGSEMLDSEEELSSRSSLTSYWSKVWQRFKRVFRDNGQPNTDHTDSRTSRATSRGDSSSIVPRRRSRPSTMRSLRSFIHVESVESKIPMYPTRPER